MKTLVKISLVLAIIFGLTSNNTAIAQKFIAHHNMTSAQYQQKFDTYVKRGYRLTHVAGYGAKGKAYYAAIWEKKSGGAWVARHGMTSAKYQAEFNKFTKKGYRLTHVSGYSVNKRAYYAAIWEKKAGGAWVARHGMTSAKYQAEFNKYTKQGYRLVNVSGYGVNGKAYYAAIWEKKAGGAWIARHGMTSAKYQVEFNKAVARGFRLVEVSGYTVNGKDYYAAIWEKKRSNKWVARHGMTSAKYQAEFNKYVGQGYRLVDVSGYTVKGQIRFAAFWDK